MNAKAMIALYRYRIALSKGEDKVDALIQAIHSVAHTWYEYAEIYNAVKGVL